MKSINFDTGERNYVINGDEDNIISINIENPNLLANMETVKDKALEIANKYSDIDSPNELLMFDEEIKRLIDSTFCADISSHAFGRKSCFSKVGDKFIFETFLEAFIEIITEDMKKLVTVKEETNNIDGYINNAIEIDPEYAEFLKWKEQNK